ncbi:MAG: sodium ion-translocating decarboxylase subunit beta [Aigarchaeota archaeon]|nr:sodium ion-translocating decarboxylase subunit beta [Aigarchaeota archaeon]MCX8192889.1 sodium ion-translocating decarboxylase subunit beta [Nitrososphaeria archaeon]
MEFLTAYAGNIIMITVGFILIYLAIKKGYEPLLLIPIGFGAILVNIPHGELMEVGGFIRYLYEYGILTELFPILIFIGIGAMIDFGPLFGMPWVLLLTIPAQVGIPLTMILALTLGFTPERAASIGIIGAMDGPTAIYVASLYAEDLLGPIAVSAYMYISIAPLLIVPLSRLLLSKKERLARMPYKQGTYSRILKIIFPIIVTIVIGLLAPKGLPLIGALMFGNFLKECGVVERLSKSAQNELSNIVTLLLGLSIGGTMVAEKFINLSTLMVFGLGVIAFITDISFGLIAGKIAYYLTRGKINPLLGATGISAFPMAARTAHLIARQEDPDNWILMHTIATNTGGQIASVIAGAVVLSLIPQYLGL